MDLDFDKIYKIPTAALHVTRLHPYIKKDIKICLQSFLWHGPFTVAALVVMYNIIYYDLKANDFYQTCKNGTMLIIYSVITFQYFILSIHRQSILKLIYLIKRDYKRINNLTSEEKLIVENYANRGKYVCKQWIIISFLGSSLFLFKSIFFMVYYYYKNEFRLVFYYDLVYPTVVENNKDNLILYIIINIWLIEFGVYASAMYIAYVPLGPIFMLHASGQLSIVRSRIDNVFTEINDEVIKEKLITIIQHLQYIDSFVDIIQDVFKIAYELTLKSTTIMLPVTVYEVIETLRRGEISLEFMTFIVGAALFSSSPCYYSQLLLEKGEEVRQAIYSCGWEHHYDRRTRTTLQIMLLHALRPVAVRTVFRTLCLNALMHLCQQSYTIFNLMNAMYN